MDSQLVGVLTGAAIGFGFTWILQTREFRRRSRELVREHLGLTRGLRADLYAAKLTVEVAIKHKELTGGAILPVALWEAHGHRTLGVLHRPGEQALIDTFSRFGILNRQLAQIAQLPGATLKLEGDILDISDLTDLIDKIDHAVVLLDGLESEGLQREYQLHHPVRSRLPEWLPRGGNQHD